MKSNNIKLTELWWIVAAWPETTSGKWEMVTGMRSKQNHFGDPPSGVHTIFR